MENEKTIIEINGVRMELDLRNAREIENYRVGDPVKVLVKEYDYFSYTKTFKSYPGIIIGFDNFKKQPTIVLAYLKIDYSGGKINFVYFNSANPNQGRADENDRKMGKNIKNFIEVEICPMAEIGVTIDKEMALDNFNREILKAEAVYQDLKKQRKYFLDNFGMYFKGFIGKGGEPNAF